MSKSNFEGKGKKQVQELPTMSDESAAQYRQKLIGAGIIKQRTQEELEQERLALINAQRQRLVESGDLRPGNGFFRHKSRKKPIFTKKVLQ